MTEPTMTVGGAALAGTGTLDVIDPSTGEVFAQAPACDRDQLDGAMAAAAGAFDGWKADEKGRRAALLDAAGLIEAAVGTLAPLLTKEQGKPLPEARMEIVGSCAWLRYYANMDLPREIVENSDRGFAEVVRRPLGVVAAITPWNFPVALALWKLAPALRAGNTVVLKPSPHAPLTVLAIGALLREVFPPGVLNVVTGPDPLGVWMTEHPVPRKISFTGSTATGKRIMAGAAPDLKRLTLELGGNDPAIVLDDADPELIAEALFWGAFRNNGQICLGIKRVYAHRSVYGSFVEALAAQARAARVGSGLADGVVLGPIGNRPQFNRVAELVADARDAGAVVAAGGEAIDRPGYFFSPTVLAGVADGTRIVDEEQFGPALPVVAYDDEQDVVALVNAGPFGLTASVWSSDPDRAAVVASRVDCGQVSVNAHGVGLRPDLPFGGHKWSGLGVENGRWGLEGFTELQVLMRPGG